MANEKAIDDELLANERLNQNLTLYEVANDILFNFAKNIGIRFEEKEK